MTIAAPVTGECAQHPGTPAHWACQRCGTFVCTACENRTRPEAPPLCPRCWALRSQVVLNIRELVRGSGGTSRWMNVAGLSLTGVAILAWTTLIFFAVTSR